MHANARANCFCFVSVRNSLVANIDCGNSVVLRLVMIPFYTLICVWVLANIQSEIKHLLVQSRILLQQT